MFNLGATFTDQQAREDARHHRRKLGSEVTLKGDESPEKGENKHSKKRILDSFAWVSYTCLTLYHADISSSRLTISRIYRLADIFPFADTLGKRSTRMI